MTYSRQIRVEFQHCDPAARVFYPRYFEMMNSVVETFFAEVVGTSFAAMHRESGRGVPTVDLAAEFPAATRLGDVLNFVLRIERIGGASLTLSHRATCRDELRLSARQVLVWVEGDRARPWPEEMRAALAAYQEHQG